MIQESIQKITEKVSFEQKSRFSTFLSRCIHDSYDTKSNTYSHYSNVLFIIEAFFAGLNKFSNSYPRNKKIEVGIDTLEIILDELGIDLDKKEIFIFFHLRDLGKFKLKEDKLFAQLKPLWGEFKDCSIEKSDFSDALKSLTRTNLIEYKKGNIALKKEIIITYKR